jgi:predicted nucleic acid-binding protein
MSVRSFVDSNVLVYAHDADAGERHHRAVECLEDLWADHAGSLSTQVLQEFYVNVTQKIGTPLSRDAAREVVRDYSPWVECLISPGTIVRASEIAEIWRISFWDGMIIAAAEQCRAERLFTEDLSHGDRIAGIEIVNPFR